MLKDSNQQRTGLFVFVTTCVITVILYGRALGYGFISYDDLALLPGNPDRSIWDTWRVIPWMFTNFTLQDWQPLTWVSLLIDYYLFGFAPEAYHRTNILLYVVTCVLLYLLVLRITTSQRVSIAVAILFAVHPLHVEPVVWISQRKEMLSGVFWMLTLLSYLGYATSENEGKGRQRRYAVTLLLFMLGVMTKPTLVSLPIVLLLLDYWPLNRLSSKSDFLQRVVEKIPFFVIAGLSCYMTLFAVSSGETGSVRSIEELSWMHRIQNVSISYFLYLFKTIVPYPLYFLYSHPESYSLAQVLGAVAVIVIFTLGALALIKKRPYFFIGWIWFLVILVPMIGLIQVGGQSMADRYAYIAHIGLIMALICFIDQLVGKKIFVTLVVVAVGLFSVLTWKQVGVWKDSETLYRHTLNHDSNNYFIQEALCEELSYQKRFEEAILECQKAIEIDPHRAKVYQTLGRSYFQMKDYQQAKATFFPYLNLIIHIRDDLKRNENDLRESFSSRMDQVIVDSKDAQSFYDLGNFWVTTGDYLLAVDAYLVAIDINPNAAMIHTNLANVYFLMGEMKRAEKEFQRSLKLEPGNLNANFNYGLFLEANKKNQESIKYFKKTLEINPDHKGAKKRV